MTMTKGSPLGVEGIVEGDVYDAPKGTGYGVSNQITVEGTPGEKVILDGIWDSIEATGDLPIWVSTTLTWTGREWPWTKIVSKFDINYQAVHMAEGSILATIAAVILYALPYIASILLVLLGWRIVTYTILKIEDVAKWLELQKMPIGVGLGAGVVLLGALILLRDDK